MSRWMDGNGKIPHEALVIAAKVNPHWKVPCTPPSSASNISEACPERGSIVPREGLQHSEEGKCPLSCSQIGVMKRSTCLGLKEAGNKGAKTSRVRAEDFFKGRWDA